MANIYFPSDKQIFAEKKMFFSHNNSFFIIYSFFSVYWNRPRNLLLLGFERKNVWRDPGDYVDDFMDWNLSETWNLLKNTEKILKSDGAFEDPHS